MFLPQCSKCRKNPDPAAESGDSGKNQSAAHQDDDHLSDSPSCFRHRQDAGCQHQETVADAGSSFKGNGHTLSRFSFW